MKMPLEAGLNMSNRLFWALDGSSYQCTPTWATRGTPFCCPPVRGSSKLRKLCARWAVIAAKTLVMMTLSAVSLSVLPIKNLYKDAAKLPVHKTETVCTSHHQVTPSPHPLSSLNRYNNRQACYGGHLINFTFVPSCDKNAEGWLSLASSPGDKMQH